MNYYESDDESEIKYHIVVFDKYGGKTKQDAQSGINIDDHSTFGVLLSAVIQDLLTNTEFKQYKGLAKYLSKTDNLAIVCGEQATETQHISWDSLMENDDRIHSQLNDKISTGINNKDNYFVYLISWEEGNKKKHKKTNNKNKNQSKKNKNSSPISKQKQNKKRGQKRKKLDKLKNDNDQVDDELDVDNNSDNKPIRKKRKKNLKIKKKKVKKVEKINEYLWILIDHTPSMDNTLADDDELSRFDKTLECVRTIINDIWSESMKNQLISLIAFSNKTQIITEPKIYSVNNKKNMLKSLNNDIQRKGSNVISYKRALNDVINRIIDDDDNKYSKHKHRILLFTTASNNDTTLDTKLMKENIRNNNIILDVIQMSHTYRYKTCLKDLCMNTGWIYGIREWDKLKNNEFFIDAFNRSNSNDVVDLLSSDDDDDDEQDNDI